MTGALADLAFMALVIGVFVAAARIGAARGGARSGRPLPKEVRPPADSRTGDGRPQRSRPTPAQLALLAAALSFLVPGLGHFLIRAWSRGLIWLGGLILIGVLSAGAQSPIVLVLSFVAAIDAYLTARTKGTAA